MHRADAQSELLAAARLLQAVCLEAAAEKPAEQMLSRLAENYIVQNVSPSASRASSGSAT